MTARLNYLRGVQEAEYDISKDRLPDAVGHALTMLASTCGSEGIEDANEVAHAAGYAETILSHLANTGVVPFTRQGDDPLVSRLQDDNCPACGANNMPHDHGLPVCPFCDLGVQN